METILNFDRETEREKKNAHAWHDCKKFGFTAEKKEPNQFCRFVLTFAPAFNSRHSEIIEFSNYHVFMQSLTSLSGHRYSMCQSDRLHFIENIDRKNPMNFSTSQIVFLARIKNALLCVHDIHWRWIVCANAYLRKRFLK